MRIGEISEANYKELYNQKKFECEVMQEQLDSIGLSLGETTENVVKVVRCKDCKYNAEYSRNGEIELRCEWMCGMLTSPNFFCADGEAIDCG